MSDGLISVGVFTMTLLDITQQYGYRDRSEIAWRFSWENVGDEQGWFVFMTRPGDERALCIGRVPEDEVVKKLKENPPLQKDDLIDLELWMAHGGLDQFKPKEKKVRKKKEPIT